MPPVEFSTFTCSSGHYRTNEAEGKETQMALRVPDGVSVELGTRMLEELRSMMQRFAELAQNHLQLLGKSHVRSAPS